MASSGEHGNPLYSVIQPQVDVSPEAGDSSMGYGTVDLEMIDFGPHNDYAYHMDNPKVWKIMYNICSDDG
jgi:hypothetical protein